MQSFNTPSIGNPQAFNHSLCLGCGEFEPCLAGVGKLNQKCPVFPVEYKCYFFFNMKVFKEIVHFHKKMAQRKGLQGQGFNAWSMSRKSWLLILPFTCTKKLTIISGSGLGHLNMVFVPGIGI